MAIDELQEVYIVLSSRDFEDVFLFSPFTDLCIPVVSLLHLVDATFLPLLLKKHSLAMSQINRNSWPSPCAFSPPFDFSHPPLCWVTLAPEYKAYYSSRAQKITSLSHDGLGYSWVSSLTPTPNGSSLETVSSRLTHPPSPVDDPSPSKPLVIR